MFIKYEIISFHTLFGDWYVFCFTNDLLNWDLTCSLKSRDSYIKCDFNLQYKKLKFLWLSHHFVLSKIFNTYPYPWLISYERIAALSCGLWSNLRFLLIGLSQYNLSLELIIWSTSLLFLMLSSIILLISKLYYTYELPSDLKRMLFNFFISDAFSLHECL